MIAIRIILLLLPLFGVIYYLRWRYRLKTSGRAADDEDLKRIRYMLMGLIGVMIVLAVTWRFFDTTSTDRYKVYVPPHVVDGKVVPGSFKDAEEVPEPDRKQAPQEQE